MSFLRFNYDLFKVSRNFKVKFQVILSEDVQSTAQQYISRRNGYKPVISGFKTKDNKYYYNINPHPYLLIDITDPEYYDTTKTVTLNRRDLFVFTKELKSYIDSFVENEDLFIYKNDKLEVVNSEISKVQKIVHLMNGKEILLRPHVLTINNEYVEGSLFCINKIDSSTMLTYDDLCYLYYELNKVDMSALSTSAILVTCANIIDHPEDVENISFARKSTVDVVEVKPTEIVDVKPEIIKPDTSEFEGL